MNKVWHHYSTWECVHAGMYDDAPSIGLEAGMASYAKFFRDGLFPACIDQVFSEWPISCEQFLTDASSPFNRIAWLGQASCCIKTGLPRVCRGGYRFLTIEEQIVYDGIASREIERWESEHIKKSRKLFDALELPRLFGRHSGRGSFAANEGAAGSIVQGYLPGFAFE
tara:strand:- start:171 stop:674 length:504 start_codon:yes stop_codon:yes gene_type:complete